MGVARLRRRRPPGRARLRATDPRRPDRCADLLEAPRRRPGARRAGRRAVRARPRAQRRPRRSSPSRDAWFTYYYWLDDDRAPDFARTVEIHRKPGYDPAELFFDPADRLAKPRAGIRLVRKKLGLRYTMRVVPLDPSWVKGSHGRLPTEPRDAPVFITSDAALARETVAATEVHDLILAAAGVTHAVAGIPS